MQTWSRKPLQKTDCTQALIWRILQSKRGELSAQMQPIATQSAEPAVCSLKRITGCSGDRGHQMLSPESDRPVTPVSAPVSVFHYFSSKPQSLILECQHKKGCYLWRPVTLWTAPFSPACVLKRMGFMGKGQQKVVGIACH